MKCTPKVAVLISTFNGETYIFDQLNSVMKQSYRNFHIYVRDDGSTDKTVSLLEKFSRAHPEMVSIYVGANLGVINSFNDLIADVDSDLYATCDQDDIWLPEKIMDQVNLYRHRRLSNNNPFMCFSDPCLYVAGEQTGARLSDIQAMNIDGLVKNYKNLIAMNPVAGCTMLFCDVAKKLYLTSTACGWVMHDHLMAVLVCRLGELDFCNSKHVLYRQHSANVVGNKDTSMRYLFSRLKDIRMMIEHDRLLLNAVDSSDYDKILHVYRKVILNLFRFGRLND